MQSSTLFLLVTVAVLVASVSADWDHGAQNVPFSAEEKAKIKKCLKKRGCKKLGGPRVCTEDGKRFINACKLQCARDEVGFASPLHEPCPQGDNSTGVVESA